MGNTGGTEEPNETNETKEDNIIEEIKQDEISVLSNQSNKANKKLKNNGKASGISAVNSSSFGGGIDPIAKFKQTIQYHVNHERLPGLYKQRKYNVYVWRECIFSGHDSIVIGTANDNDGFGYCTMELRIDDEDNPKGNVIPYTQYITINDGLEYIKTKKWQLSCDIETSLDALMLLTIELIQNHGTYSSLHNGCQHFVYAFIWKVIYGGMVEWSNALKKARENDLIYQNSKGKLFGSWIRDSRNKKIKQQMLAQFKQENKHIPYSDKTEYTPADALLCLMVPGMLISKDFHQDNKRYKVKFKRDLHEYKDDDEQIH